MTSNTLEEISENVNHRAVLKISETEVWEVMDRGSPEGNSTDSDMEENTPSSPIFSGRRKHSTLKRKKSDETGRTLTFSPTGTPEQKKFHHDTISSSHVKETAERSELSLTTLLEPSQSPISAGALSVRLGCDATPAWGSQMETPVTATLASDELNTLERKELLPSSTVSPPHILRERKIGKPRSLFNQEVKVIKRSDLLPVELGNRKENVPNKSLEHLNRTTRPSPGSSYGQTPGKLLGGRRPHPGVISSPAQAQNKISTGFQTARGGTVLVSRESMVKVERDFLKLVGGDSSGGVGSGQGVNISEEAVGEAGKVAEERMEAGKMAEERRESVNGGEGMMVTGFRTAGGSSIQVSERALREVKKTLPSVETGEAGLTGFTTAGGNKIEVPAEALNAAKQKFNSFNSIESSGGFGGKEPSGLETVGFSTARGTKIEVSAEALRSAKQKFAGLTSEVDAGGAFASKESVGFSTAKGTKIEVSAEALKSAKEKFSGLSSTVEAERSLSSKEAVGFSTAKGTKIDVSAEALEAAKQKFTGVTSTVEAGGSFAGKESVGFSTARGTKIEVSSDALKAAKEKFSGLSATVEAGRSTSGNETVGFSTANGAKIEVSAEALRSAKQKFASSNSTALSSGTAGQSGLPAVGFSTAKGTKIEISAKALTAAKQMFDSLSNENRDEHEDKAGPSGINSVGFSTAKGTKIEVSDRALAAAKLMFDDTSSKDCDKIEKISEVPDVKPDLDSSENNNVQEKPSSQWEDDEDEFLQAIQILDCEKEVKVQSFTCHPYELEPEEKAYTSNPEQFNSNVTEETKSGGFHVPVARKEKEVKKEINLDLRLTRGAASEDVTSSRLKSREKQEKLIAEKAKRKINPLPGKLTSTRSKAEQRMSLQSQSLTWNESCRRRMSWEEAAHFKFRGEDHFSEETVENNVAGVSLGDGMVVILDDVGNIGPAEIEKCLLAGPGVDPSLVAPGWVPHHYSWLVWTLHCYERRLAGGEDDLLLTPANLLNRLKYRYDREIDGGERSVIRQIMEHDEAAGVLMVLCVVSVSEERLILSDGWYHLPCPLYQGSALQRLVSSGKIVVGVKLVTAGAELKGSQAGKPCHPLEEGATEGRELRIHVNSTRRAVRWAKLGKLRARSLTLKLSTLRVGGGSVASLAVQLVRVYPLLYYVKVDGKSRWFSERDFEKQQRRTGTSDGDLYHQVEKELLEEELEGLPQKVSVRNLHKIFDGEELYNIFRSNDDPALVSCLSVSQISLLEQTKEAKCHQMRTKIQEEVEARRKGQKTEATAVLKMRVVALGGERSERGMSGLVTIWRPGPSWAGLVEGSCVEMSGCGVSRVEGHTVHLTASKNTHCHLLQEREHDNRRTITPLAALTTPGFRPQFNELDAVVTVISVQEEPTRLVVMVADVAMSPVYLMAWGPAKLRAEQTNVSLLKTGNVLSCKNLEWRQGSSYNNLPSLHVSDATLITMNPREKDHVSMVENLKSVMNNNQQFVSQARERTRFSNRRVSRPSQSPPQPRTEEVLVSSAWTGRTQTKLNLLDRSIEQHRERLGRQSTGSPVSSSPAAYLRPPRPSVMTQFKSPLLKK